MNLSETMTDEEINEGLAKAMGSVVNTPDVVNKNWLYAREGVFYKHKPEYATSHDAFHTYVVPELERRGLMERWHQQVVAAVVRDCGWPDGARVLTASPHIKCEAALEVMGGAK